MTATPYKPAIYGRQSAAMVKSIKDQLVIGHGCALELAGVAPVEYSDDVSASRYSDKTRGGWDDILSDIRARRINWLWLWESSRGDRRSTEWSAFLDLCEERGVILYIHSHERAYDLRLRNDWKTLAMEGVANDDETRKISERVRRGLDRNAAEGKPHSKTAYGYLRVRDPYTGEYLDQEPDERPRKWGSPADVVRQIFADAQSGTALRQIAMRLNEAGVPTPRLLAALERPATTSAPRRRPPKGVERWEKTVWRTSNMRDILRRRAYIGERVWKHGEATAGAWPALVDPGVFFAVQDILNDPERRHEKPTTVRHLLTFIARCGHCDARLEANGNNHLGEDRYRCAAGYHCAAPMALLDKEVTSWLIRWVTAPGRLQALYDLENNDAANTARADADRYRTELDAWRAQLDDPTVSISAGAWGKREAVLIASLADAERLARTSSKLVVTQEFADASDVDKAVQIWAGLPISRRRSIIREVLTVKLYGIGKGSHAATAPGRIVLAPRIEV